MQLLRKRHTNDNSHEDGLAGVSASDNEDREATYEELVLGSLHSILGLEEREADEEARKDTHHEFCHHERWVSPMRYIKSSVNI